MKKLLYSLTLTFLTAAPLASFGQPSWQKDPAYLPIDKVLDLKTIKPEVNVNLPRFLLQNVVTGLTNGPGGPLAGTGIDLADLLKDVKLIRVVVIEGKKNDREALDKGVKTLRAELESKWTPIVSVPNDNVGVYAMGTESGDSMAGLAVLVYDHGEAVIGNVVGQVSIGKLIQMATRMRGLRGGKLHDLLQNLGGMGGQTSSHSTRVEPTHRRGDHHRRAESKDASRTQEKQTAPSSESAPDNSAAK
jgi:Domain of unknown function (DUF4252)